MAAISEVLSQSQIDELLKSVGSSELDGDSSLEDSLKKERKYDFRAPKRFTKDRLKLLDSVYSTYARIISSYLTSILRLSCDVELVDVEEQKYNEFNNALNENDVMAVIDVAMENNRYDSDPVMMQISNHITYLMLDRMLGGTGEPGEEENRSFTDIELTLYSNLVGHIIPLMNDAWQSYFNINFGFSKAEANPRLMQIFSMDDIVVIVVLNITVNNISGKVNIY